MKKVILSAAALMCGAMIFAQNVQNFPTPAAPADDNISDVEQTGYQNQATVHQTDQNTSYVDQEYYQNHATVTQVGNNWSSIDQSGDVNNHIDSGKANEATVDQNGGDIAFQLSDIDQEGNRNWANVGQTGQDNKSSIVQGTNQQSENNWAFVRQTSPVGTAAGDGNSVRIMQRYDNNGAIALQNGTNNSIVLEQVAAPDKSPGNFASHNQDGDNNSITSFQSTANAAPTFTVAGFSNGELVVQTGDDNKSVLHQEGNNNASVVLQYDGLIKGSGSIANSADVTQMDDFNASYINQGLQGSSSMNTAVVNQSGSNGWNLSSVYQRGQNTATVTQINN